MGSRKLIPVTLAAALLLACSAVFGQQVLRNYFETRQTSWMTGNADAVYKELVHEMTDKTAHTGQLCEHIQLNAEKGNFIYYYIPTSKAPICDELTASLWVKANRPGIQLMARLVLPKERDPHNLDERLTTLIPGKAYVPTGFWQRLDMGRPANLAVKQQQLLQANLQRSVDFSDAYIDRLVLQVYVGPGLTDVWIDDLEMSPVVENAPAPAATAAATTTPGRGAAGERKDRLLKGAVAVELNQDHMLVDGKPYLFRGIRYSDTPLPVLRNAGFNTLWVDYRTPQARLDEALSLGFRLVPSLPVATSDPRLASRSKLEEEIDRFPAGDAVLFWDLGGGLMAEQKDVLTSAVNTIHGADAHPLGADVWDGFMAYSRKLDLVGVHRWPLMTGMELTRYRDWLNQRRQLCRPGTFTWTWIQTHQPDWYASLLHDRPGGGSFNEPVGPSGEQVRLLTYIALAAGCRGLGYWSDRALADSQQGRDRLLTLAMLNQEMQLLEPFLLSYDEPPRWITTQNPDVLCAVIRCKHGVLALPMWIGGNAQFVPGQSAAGRLIMTVPDVPAGTQAFELSPADVKPVEMERVPGGYKVTLSEFSLTRALVFTPDTTQNGLLVYLQQQTEKNRKAAAQWSIDLAKAEMEKVVRVEEELQRLNRTLPDGQRLLERARDSLRRAEEAWRNDDFRLAYAEGERALRPLRIIMRLQWNQAVRRLDTPVASPYAVSYYTLPQHWKFVDEIVQYLPGANVLPDGDFEMSPTQVPKAWSYQEANLDELELVARRITVKPKEGQQCLMLAINRRKTVNPDGKPLPLPQGLERTYLAINSPAVRLPPGTLVRISFWVKVPLPILASSDGALFYDSSGGEPLALRLSAPTEWKQYQLFRWVPASGLLNVTMAITGLGSVLFDDVRIEPLQTVRNATVAGPRTRGADATPLAKPTGRTLPASAASQTARTESSR